MKMKLYLLIWIAGFSFVNLYASVDPLNTNHPKSNLRFTPMRIMDVQPVKDQGRSSTCWSFSGMSFFEAEMIRMGKTPVDLSEMYVVRMTYLAKALKFVRMHGTIAFPPGGAFSDPVSVLKNHGLMPREAYTGDAHAPGAAINHGELDEALEAFVTAIVKNKGKHLSEVWLKAVEGILDAYLGKIPAEFSYKGKKMNSPEQFKNEIGLNAENYVSLTSFNHHPFYKSFSIEVPDNWAWDISHNLPLNEFVETALHALKNGFTLAWASDVSDPGFSHKYGIAIAPIQDLAKLKPDELEAVLLNPVEEKDINQTLRQRDFNNYSTTDDHGMHIMGLVKDQNGKQYFVVKNSWGTDRNECGGFLYVSESFFKLRTLSIMVHKDGIPSPIRKKLAI
jgi:bleomycin hydrolase